MVAHGTKVGVRRRETNVQNSMKRGKSEDIESIVAEESIIGRKRAKNGVGRGKVRKEGGSNVVEGRKGREEKIKRGLCRAQVEYISNGQVFKDKADGEPDEENSKDQRGGNAHAKG